MSENARILALDCATGPTSVAVWDGGRVAVYLEDKAATLQSARMLPMVEQALKEAGLAYADLSAVACTTGPGSFTGIRVALAAARGICFAAKVKGMGFTTLEVLAAGSTGQVCAVLNAGKGEWYYQHFLDGRPMSEPQVAAPEKIKPVAGLVVGNVEGAGFALWPRADMLAQLAATSSNASSLTPFYIRPPDAIPAARNF